MLALQPDIVSLEYCDELFNLLDRIAPFPYAHVEQVFREDLQRNRHNPRSLFGLAEALRAQKKKGANARMAEFHQRWRGGALRVADL